MRALFEVTHPAHVHLFRPAMRALQARGDDVVVTSRDDDVTTALLDAADITHRELSTAGDGVLSLAAEWAGRELRLLSVVRETRPDIVVGRLNPALAHVSTLTRTPSLVVMDTKIRSPTIARLYHGATYPFVNTVCAPREFEFSDGIEHRPLDFQELAYLHPDRFQPDADALREHGVDPNEPYTIARFTGVDAYHDAGFSGFSPEARGELSTRLAEHGAVYVSEPAAGDEEGAELPVPPHMAHDLLAYADLFVGDSGTMSSEAAVLGTPAIRLNTMVGIDEERVFRALEHTYGLLSSFADEDAALDRVDAVLAVADCEVWARRRQHLLDEQGDPTAELLDYIDDVAPNNVPEPESEVVRP